MSHGRFVVIDSFDTPNPLVIKPKKYVDPVTRATPYPNPGPMDARRQDMRNAVSQPHLNGGVQDTQILLLTSVHNPLLDAQALPQPVNPNAHLAPWCVDVTPNGGGNVVTDGDGKLRRQGYRDRVKTVDDRMFNSNQLQVIYTAGVRRRPAYANDVSKETYADGSVPRRVRMNVRDEFVSMDGAGYTHHPRYVWCPPGIRIKDVRYGADFRTMTAIGCSCRDMLERGMTHARYGCKHIIAYNRAKANQTLVTAW